MFRNVGVAGRVAEWQSRGLDIETSRVNTKTRLFGGYKYWGLPNNFYIASRMYYIV